MNSKVLIVIGLVIGIFAIPEARCYTIVSFNPGTVFSGTGASQVAAMDVLVGVSGYTIENFEDGPLISGMTIAFDGNAATSDVSGSIGSTPANTIWDADNKFLANAPDDVVFSFSDIVVSFGVGLGDVESDIRVFVNGSTDLGLVRSLPNYSRVQDNRREVYFRIDVEGGDAPISSVSFEQEGTMVGDTLHFDHLAIDVVPEPSRVFFVILGALGVVMRRHRRG